jgi:hypothetical protein
MIGDLILGDDRRPARAYGMVIGLDLSRPNPLSKRASPKPMAAPAPFDPEPFDPQPFEEGEPKDPNHGAAR